MLLFPPSQLRQFSRPEPGSFRDRRARVFTGPDGIFRCLQEEALEEWKALASTAFYPRLVNQGKLIATVEVDAGEAWKPENEPPRAAVLQHEQVPFISYPYEWSFGMLQDAALLHLELLDAALDEDMILKDASAFNVQFRGCRPVFIDIPSFVRLQPGEPWVGYRQFCELFLYPLLLQAYKDVPFQPWLRGDLEGINAEQCCRLMSFRDLFRSGVFLHVWLQAQVQRRYCLSARNLRRDLRVAGFSKELIRANVRRLAALLRRLAWRPAASKWSDYELNHSYASADQERKIAFVREVVASRSWKLVWDIGCNTGTYSTLAAENAATVLALDADQLSIERLYQRLRADGNKNVLPLVVNIANPSPNQGWRGGERKGLTERGKPDLTLCLALIHHVVIGANIPLGDFLAWLADLGSDLVIEFVTKDDPMVLALLRNKDDQYPEYGAASFEQSLGRLFAIRRREVLGSGTRILYHGKAQRGVRGT